MIAECCDAEDQMEKTGLHFRACSDGYVKMVSRSLHKSFTQCLLMIARFLPNPPIAVVFTGCLPIFVLDLSRSFSKT